MTGDKVTGEFYMTRSDGVKLLRFAVPNIKRTDKDGNEFWDRPQFLIRQDQTGIKYAEAIDVETALYTYTETDEPIDSGEESSETEQKAEAWDALTEVNNNE